MEVVQCNVKVQISNTSPLFYLSSSFLLSLLHFSSFLLCLHNSSSPLILLSSSIPPHPLPLPFYTFYLSSGQVQRLQETHTTLLASREQQASSHRLQLQQLAEQERVRQEELSRCRAQVASLSAELAAERQVGEEARRQVALSKAEAARYQAQVQHPHCVFV